MAQITALIAFNNTTQQILWSEGCDPDGYSHHQIIVEKKEISEDTLAAMPDWMKRNWDSNPESPYVNLSEQEAKDFTGDFGDLTITMKTFEIPDSFSEL